MQAGALKQLREFLGVSKELIFYNSRRRLGADDTRFYAVFGGGVSGGGGRGNDQTSRSRNRFPDLGDLVALQSRPPASSGL
eukprot:929089-Pyramimonas_sp.AAC.1